MLSPACGVFIMQYASNAHAASARSYEFGMNSLSRLRERAGVRGASSSSGGPHPHPPPAGEGIEAGEGRGEGSFFLFWWPPPSPSPSGGGNRGGRGDSLPLWLSLLPPLGEGRDGGLPGLRRAAAALHDSRQFPSCNMPLAPIQQALVAMNLV